MFISIIWLEFKIEDFIGIRLFKFTILLYKVFILQKTYKIVIKSKMNNKKWYFIITDGLNDFINI